MHVLLRLHDPHAGAVTLDGWNPPVRLGDLRANIAVVLQETLVFDGTSRENIRWGRPTARRRRSCRPPARPTRTSSSPAANSTRTRVASAAMMLSGGHANASHWPGHDPHAPVLRWTSRRPGWTRYPPSA